MDRKQRLVGLLAQAKEGNEDALSTLLWEHFDDLCRYLAPDMPADLTHLVATEDIAAQVMYEAFRDFAQFRVQPGGSFTAWLKTIAKHRLLDAIKKLRKEENLRATSMPHADLSSYADLVELLPDDGLRASAVARSNEAHRALQNALNELADDRREVMLLRYHEDLSIEEIAERLATSTGAVRGLLDRAKQELRGILVSMSRFISRR